MTLAIDASGLHPSTTACLEAIERLHGQQDFANILDLGCGSGILSLAAAHCWGNASILAADISPNAVEDTLRSVREHGLQERITVIRSDAFSNPLIAQKAPYDLILANLLAETLHQNALNIKKSLNTNSYCILSGILSWLSEGVEQTLAKLGFEFEAKITNSPWQAYILRNTTET